MACLCTLVLCGGIFFKLLPSLSLNLQLDWNSLSAIGTLSAVLVSLWLARSSDRKTRREEKQRGELAASRIWPIAGAMNAQLSEFVGWVYFDDLDSSEPISDIRDKFKKLQVFADRISREDVQDTVSLDISVASYLARAIGEIEGVIVSVEREIKEWGQISRLQKEFFRSTWGDAVVNSRDLLLLALPTLEYAAQKAAPLPDWAKIYATEQLEE